MNSDDHSRFIKVLETDALTDIALIKGTLDGEGVRYIMQGEILKHVRPGDQPVTLLVHEDDIDRAIELLKPLNLLYTHHVVGPRARP